MKFAIASLAALAFAAPAFAQTAPATPAGENPVDPYEVSDANAGASPITDPAVLAAFNGQEGVGRIVDDVVDSLQKHERLKVVFEASDFVRLRRTLKEQICYILGGGCAYTGRDMTSVHEDHGSTVAEFNALVELLQDAMNREGVPFAMQNKLLAKLAPMKRDVAIR
jgi:hemoglobin